MLESRHEDALVKLVLPVVTVLTVLTVIQWGFPAQVRILPAAP